MILDYKECDVLLGLDFFNETNAGIYPKRRLLKFPSEDIFIPGNCQKEIYDENDVYLVNELENPELRTDLYEWDFRDVGYSPCIKLPKYIQQKFEDLIQYPKLRNTQLKIIKN